MVVTQHQQRAAAFKVLDKYVAKERREQWVDEREGKGGEEEGKEGKGGIGNG